MSIRYITRRFLLAVGALVVIVTATFVLVRVAPGGSVEAMAGEGASQAQLDEMTARFRLDEPLPDQFASYLSHLLRGDLGNSYVYNRPVSGLIGERLPATLLLTGTSFAVGAFAGVGLGALAARRSSGLVDTGVRAATLIIYGVPVFWLAQLGVMLFALRAQWFPVEGMTDARLTLTGTANAVDVARHLFLPVLVLSASEVALLARTTRAGLVQERVRDYVRTARAKGLDEGGITTHHALPNAMLPVMTIIGGRLGHLFAGAVIVETVFAWPGLGTLLVNAAIRRDYPIVLGMVLLTAFSVVMIHVVTDVVSARIDPRIRLR